MWLFVVVRKYFLDRGHCQLGWVVDGWVSKQSLGGGAALSSCRRLPNGERACAQEAIVRGSQQVAPQAEEIVDDIGEREKSLRLAG